MRSSVFSTGSKPNQKPNIFLDARLNHFQLLQTSECYESRIEQGRVGDLISISEKNCSRLHNIRSYGKSFEMLYSASMIIIGDISI